MGKPKTLLIIALVPTITGLSTGAYAGVDANASPDLECERVFMNRLVFPLHDLIGAGPTTQKGIRLVEAGQRRAQELIETVVQEIAQYMEQGHPMEELHLRRSALYNRWLPVRERQAFHDAFKRDSVAYARYLTFYRPLVKQELQHVLKYFAANGSFNNLSQMGRNERKALRVLLLFGNNEIFIEEIKAYPEANRAFEDWLVSESDS